MNQSYPRKALDLALAALRRPGDIPLWLRTLPCLGRTPMDMALPWHSRGAIRWLEKHVRPTHRVFEFGGGGSTLFYARRAAEVRVAESHPDWARAIQQRADRVAPGKVSVLFHGLAENEARLYLGHPFFTCIATGAPWDIISVDCVCGFGTGGIGGVLRPHALELARQHLAPGGVIVLDDTWMFPEQLAPRPGWWVRDFRGLGPCRYGVTATAVMGRAAEGGASG